MLKRIFKTGACALCAVAMLNNFANADVLNQRDTANNTVSNIAQLEGTSQGNTRRVINITQNELIQDLSVTIEGLQHNFAGELVAQIRKVDTSQANRPSIAQSNLFNRINGSTEDSNFGTATGGGNYTFTSTGGPAAISPANIWTTGTTLGDNDFFASSTSGVSGNTIYSASGPNGNAITSQVSLANTFAGLSTAGQWELLIRDELENNVTGSFTGVTLNFQTGAAVPEPSSITLIAIGSLGLCMRRRRK